jgi:copper chaperone
LKCDGCVTTLEQAIRGEEGVNHVVGDLDDKQVMVDFDENKISVKKIKELVRQAGYTPRKVFDD